MKTFFRVLGATVALCSVLLFITLTFAVVKKVWFGKGGATSKGHVAVLDLTGMILTSGSFVKDLQDELDNSSTKAIVLRINSPGGLVAPSQEMFDALKRADEKVPVVISMGALAASGGYYAALGGRKIYANPGTLTASIGVIMEFANTSKLYQWAKVDRYTLKAGKFKDIGSPLRDMKPEERDLMTKMLADIHVQFKGAVKQRRKLADATVEEYCDGRIMTGAQAKAVKLVDELGGFEDAVKEAKALAKLPESAPVVYSESRGGLLKRLLLGDAESTFDFNFFATQWLAPARARVLLLAPLY